MQAGKRTWGVAGHGRNCGLWSTPGGPAAADSHGLVSTARAHLAEREGETEAALLLGRLLLGRLLGRRRGRLGRRRTGEEGAKRRGRAWGLLLLLLLFNRGLSCGLAREQGAKRRRRPGGRRLFLLLLLLLDRGGLGLARVRGARVGRAAFSRRVAGPCCIAGQGAPLRTADKTALQLPLGGHGVAGAARAPPATRHGAHTPSP